MRRRAVPDRKRSPRATVVTTLTLLVALGTVLAGCSSSSTSTSAPLLKVSGTSQGWVFHDAQTVTVSMGPNKIFTPHIRINIIQCADPGGSPSHLPTSINTCDENTIQADSVIPGTDGSFTEKSYTVYRLPNATLGEQPNWQPVCNETHPCVLFVGENQDDFTKPKVFSHPFTVTQANS